MSVPVERRQQEPAARNDDLGAKASWPISPPTSRGEEKVLRIFHERVRHFLCSQLIENVVPFTKNSSLSPLESLSGRERHGTRLVEEVGGGAEVKASASRDASEERERGNELPHYEQRCTEIVDYLRPEDWDDVAINRSSMGYCGWMRCQAPAPTGIQTKLIVMSLDGRSAATAPATAVEAEADTDGSDDDDDENGSAVWPCGPKKGLVSPARRIPHPPPDKDVIK